MFRLQADPQFCHALVQEIGRFAESRRLNTREKEWCFDFRHMILKRQWQGSTFTTSRQLADSIRAYCNEHLTGSFWFFVRIRTHRKLKKRLLKIIDAELVDALYRELQARHDFIRESEEAGRLSDLSIENGKLSVLLKETQEALEEHELQVLSQATEIDTLRQENAYLQTSLITALDHANRMIGEVNRLQRQVEGIPSLEREVEKLEQEVQEIPSLKEQIRHLTARFEGMEQKQRSLSYSLSQSFYQPTSDYGDSHDDYADLEYDFSDSDTPNTPNPSDFR